MTTDDQSPYMENAVALLTQSLADENSLFSAASHAFPLDLGPRPHDPNGIAAAMRRAAAVLPTIECDFQAGRLAILCGTLVERGAPTDVIAPAVATRTHQIFARVARLLAAVDPDGDGVGNIRAHYKDHPAEVRAYLGAQFAGLAAMTTLCRDAPARVGARALQGFAENADAIQHEVPAGFFLHEVLRCVDDYELLVLHPERARGYRLRLGGVRSCFHLFTLLQGALIGDPAQGWLAGPDPDPGVVALARGQVTDCEATGDSAAWHYCSWRAWTKSGLAPNAIAYSIWGEARVDAIPRFEGTPTILLTKPLLGHRGWGKGFLATLHDAHVVSLEVEARLGEDEVRDTLARIATATVEA